MTDDPSGGRAPPGSDRPPCPPGRAVRLLRRAFREHPGASAILGDLHEDFARVARSRGPRAARRWYWREAVLLALGRVPRIPFSFFGHRTMADLFDTTSFAQDAGYAMRAVRRSPGFALFTAVVIGLGVGATTAVYSIMEPLVLAPLPFDEPDELVWIANEADPGATSLSAVTSRTGNLRDFRDRARSFEAITGYNAFFEQGAYILSGTGEPERLVGAGVAGDFLTVLGVEPLHGRSFTEAEARWGGPRAVVLSHGFWQRRFAGDRGVVGRSLTMNGEPYEVVGVLPPTFSFASVFTPGVNVDFLLPFPISDETDRWGNTLSMVGRLRPGVSAGAAQAELDAVVAGLREAQPDRWGLGADVTPLQEKLAAPFRPAFLLLAAAAGTLLAIVCVNVSNLFLARAPGRAGEVAVRKAMGASRARLVRQLVLESVGIALVGAVAGAVVAWLAVRLVAGSPAVQIPLLDHVRVDGSALLFGAAVALVTGLLVGLVPALHVGDGDEAAVLRTEGRGGSQSRGARRLREGLVVAEVALACALLVTGGLLVRSFRAVLDVDLGFEPEGVVAWQLNPGDDFESLAEVADYARRLTTRVTEIPGVESAGFIDALPLGPNRTWGFDAVGVPDEVEDELNQGIFPHIVGPGYLEAMKIPLVAGRPLTRDDTGDTEPVILMNEWGARRLFQGDRALGRRLRLWDDREWTIVGVVEDVRHVTPEDGPGIQVYFPMTQMGDFGNLQLAVRSGLPTEQVVSAVSGALHDFDPSLATREFWTMSSRVERATSARRFTLWVLTAYGATALFLAALGIYGVLAHSVAERRPEIGIRMALGASSSGIVGGVMGRTLVLTVLGILAGVALSLLAARLIGSLLFGVDATDPATFGAMTVVLLVVAATAAAVPAARAARVTGVRALRAE